MVLCFQSLNNNQPSQNLCLNEMSTQAKAQPISWDYIIAKIKEKKCLLVLGHEAFNADNDHSTQEGLSDYIDLKNNPFVKRYYKHEDLYLFENKSHRTQFCHQFKNFYRQQQPCEIINLLADIPFHVYLTLTPDIRLVHSFDRKNFNYQHGFYKKNTDPQNIRVPIIENPLIYNMFGCIENEESLILSHDDLYDYFKSIFKRQSMPSQLKDELSEILNIIFLGVSFDKWYLQILLRELEIHNQQYAFTRFASSMTYNSDLSSFCHDQFQIQFIDKNIVEFVKELHDRIHADPEMTFRAGSVIKLDLSTTVRDLIAAGSIEGAIETLSEALEEGEWQDDINKLEGRFARLKKRTRAGVIGSNEIAQEEARIAENILDLLKIAKT